MSQETTAISTTQTKTLREMHSDFVLSQEISSISCETPLRGMHTPHRGRQLRCRAAARKVRFAPLKIEGLGS